MVEEIGLKAMMDKIVELEGKAKKYDEVKEKYISFAAKLGGVIEELENLRLEVDPFIKSVGSSKKHDPQRKEMEEWCLATLKAGTHLTNELLGKAFPEASEILLRNVLQKVKTWPNVQLAKDGRQLRLYM